MFDATVLNDTSTVPISLTIDIMNKKTLCLAMQKPLDRVTE